MIDEPLVEPAVERALDPSLSVTAEVRCAMPSRIYSPDEVQANEVRGNGPERWQVVVVQCLALSAACAMIYAAVFLAPYSRRMLSPDRNVPTLPPVLTHGTEPEDLPAILDAYEKAPDGPSVTTKDRNDGPVEIIARLDGRIEPYTRQ